MEKELEELAERLKDDHDQAVIDRYAALQSRFEYAGGYTYQSDIESVFCGFGFGRRIAGTCSCKQHRYRILRLPGKFAASSSVSIFIPAPSLTRTASYPANPRSTESPTVISVVPPASPHISAKDEKSTATLSGRDSSVTSLPVESVNVYGKPDFPAMEFPELL